MRIVEPGYTIEYITPDALCEIESAGRTCYRSEDRITKESAKAFVAMIIERGHHSVLEHAHMKVRFVCDRGVSHELVRHRLCAFSQESTRFCNYSKAKFDSEVAFVDARPFLATEDLRDAWLGAMANAERTYMAMLDQGVSPQIARSVLPNSLRTEIVVTTNIREWRHIFTLRTSKAAHPQMRQIMCVLLKDARKRIPVVFDDVGYLAREEAPNE